MVPHNSGWRFLRVSDVNDRGQVIGRGVSPTGQERGFLLTPRLANIPRGQQGINIRTTEGFFKNQYGVKFVGISLEIDLDIRLIGADPGETIKRAWEEGAEEMWSDQYDIIHDGVSYNVVLDLEFVDDGGNTTILVKEGEGRYSVGIPHGVWYTHGVLGWGADYRDECVAHEVGHLLGLYDEYEGGALDPSNPVIDYTSIMGSLDGVPKERHFRKILEWLEGETGNEMVLAKSPLWQAGEAGPAVDDNLPIPEPTTITLFVGMGVVIFLKRRH